MVWVLVSYSFFFSERAPNVIAPLNSPIVSSLSHLIVLPLFPPLLSFSSLSPNNARISAASLIVLNNTHTHSRWSQTRSSSGKKGGRDEGAGSAPPSSRAREMSRCLSSFLTLSRNSSCRESIWNEETSPPFLMHVIVNSPLDSQVPRNEKNYSSNVVESVLRNHKIGCRWGNFTMKLHLAFGRASNVARISCTEQWYSGIPF